MPRASDYLQEGYTYHITQRCHDRRFLLRFARDRDAYRDWLREGVKRHSVPIYGWCLTSNHVHIVLHCDNVTEVSSLMHLASGSTAKQYNVRKERSGSMWEKPYHCTVIQPGAHLLNCLCYVDLNMVRAGVVSSPSDWKWCGYHELTGHRERYRLLDREKLIESLEVASVEQLQSFYRDAIERRLAQIQQREPHWTESLAVGTKEFVEAIKCEYRNRWEFKIEEADGSAGQVWSVRESSEPYSAISGPKTVSKG